MAAYPISKLASDAGVSVRELTLDFGVVTKVYRDDTQDR